MYSPYSSATTREGFLADLQRAYLRERQSKGTAPETMGVTVPLPEPTSAADVFAEGDRWSAMNQERKGHMAYDTNETPMDDSYAQRRYDFLVGEEAVRKVAYDDKTGKPMRPGQAKQGNITVGIGFNMERPDARRVMSKVLGIDDKGFDAIYSGAQGLNDSQVRKLFDYTANEAENIVSTRLKGVTLPEHQRLALVSMAFNGPSLIGPKITAAIKNNDLNAALDEMLYNSGRNKALAGRRYREAAMFAGPGDAKMRLPEFAEYRLWAKSRA